MAIKLKCKIKVKHNFKNLTQIEKKLPQTIADGIEDILKNIRAEAIRLENGHNCEGIIVDKVDLSTGKIKSRVYADPSKFMSNGESYLWFEYFGTGKYAEEAHVGTTKHFIESGYTEWYIPVNKVERQLNYPIVQFGESQFYIAHGSKPNHFLQDAEFKTRQENQELVAKKINEMFKEVCK